jgi:hypothetical protein
MATRSYSAKAARAGKDIGKPGKNQDRDEGWQKIWVQGRGTALS